MKKQLLLLFSILWPMISIAEAIETKGLLYNIDDDNMVAEIVGYRSNGYSEDVVIPSFVEHQGETYCVKSIARDAFRGCIGIHSITIPPTIDHIGASAFNGCCNMDYVRISDLSKWCSIDFGSSYSNPLHKADHFYLGNEDITDLTIPSDVDAVTDFAFSGCMSLTHLTLPDNLKKVGYGSFAGCSNLVEVSVSKSVQSFGGSAFGGCSQLGAVRINNLPAWCEIEFANFASNPLYYAKRLYLNGDEIADLVIPEEIYSIRNYTFVNGQSIKSIDIHNRVQEIGDGAFLFCKGLTDVQIPTSVVRIGSEAFRGTGLNRIEIPENVNNIGNGCFSGCRNLSKVVIRGNILAISSGSFASCPLLEDVRILGQTETIGEEAFRNCIGLCSFSIPNSIKSIEKEAFYGCTNLYIIKEGESLESIGEEAFRGCIHLDTLRLPKSVIKIGRRAFQECIGLKTVFLPPLLKEIEKAAFYMCDSIKDVFCYAREVPSAEYAFSDPSYPGKVYVQHATLHIPYSSYQMYGVENPWWEFGSIEKLPQEPFLLEFIVEGELYKLYEVLEGEYTILEPYPKREGYSFSGWIGKPSIMPACNVSVTGMFRINMYTLTYVIDDVVYKTVEYEYGATITPEPKPEGDYLSFEWTDQPQTMPAHDVVVNASFTTGIIGAPMVSQQNLRLFSPNGKQVNKLQKGLNIVVLDDGIAKKVVVR